MKWKLGDFIDIPNHARYVDAVRVQYHLGSKILDLKVGPLGFRGRRGFQEVPGAGREKDIDDTSTREKGSWTS